MFGFTNDFMIKFSANYPLKRLNSFGFDVKTRYWATFSDDAELCEIVTYCRVNNLKWFVLGGGCNIIFSRDYDGVIIHPTSGQIVQYDDLTIADAGVVWDDFVAWAVENSMYGVENLAHIPGSVGASPVQNIGAYGVEACDTIEWVEYLDTRTMQINRINGSDCQFGYRESIFKHFLKDVAIVLRVAFRLSHEPHYNVDYGDVRSEIERLGELSLANVRQAIINIRTAKLPDPAITGNAGSFFKNPVVDGEVFEKIREKHPEMPHYEVEQGIKIPAGWLIDRAGWKGYREGDAGVHPKQALVLVNHGTATAQDVLALADKIVCDIDAKFGIALEKEVNVW